jgi:hypothetical protein
MYIYNILEEFKDLYFFIVCFNIGSVIHIESGSNFHIGNSFAFNFSQSKRPKNKKKSTTHGRRELCGELPGN